jgi:hypothetical protein
MPSDEELLNFRVGIRGMLLIGNFNDLSVEGQVHPGMQKRLMYSVPEIESTLTELVNNMRTISPGEREEIKTALHDEPDLGDRILASLDLEARSAGVTSRRRRQLNRMGKRVMNRLKHSPVMLINEYVSKFDKMNANINSDLEMEYLLKQKLGEEEYNARYGKAERAAIKWQNSNLSDMPIGYRSMKDEIYEENPSEKSNKSKYSTGLKVLGIGAIITAVGWLLIGLTGGTDAGIVLGLGMGVTIGPITILVALFILLVQALKRDPKK